jgi:tetratricopeptide (TPR) repeat protein
MRIEFLSLLLIVVVASVSAQTPSTTAETAKQSRSRTITTEPQTSEPTQTTTSQPAANQSQAPVKETSSDPVAQLREQIDSASGPERNSLRLKLVGELIAGNNKTDALAELHSLVNTDVFDPQNFYNAGNAFARLGDNEGAIQAYRKAIEQRKGHYSRALNNLGVVLLRTGRWDEAYEALTSALKLEGFRYAEASYNLGRLYAARGENDMAVREWRRVLTLDPQHTGAADALAHIGDEGRVTVVAAKVVPQPRSNEKPATKVATNNSVSPKTLVLDPVSFDLLQRARSLTEKGKTIEAVDSYRRLLSREGGYFAPANLELSLVFVTSKRFDEAISNLQMVAMRDGSHFPISYYHLGRLYEGRGDLKQAESCFTQTAAAFGKKNAQFLLDVSRVRERQGNFKGALEAMESYLSIIGEQGQQPAWSNERLTALRAKVEKN